MNGGISRSEVFDHKSFPEMSGRDSSEATVSIGKRIMIY